MPDKKHSIICIMTDQQRLDTMHYANPSSICRTPALDALAAESLCFTNAYTTTPVCTPARCSLHTGLFPSVTGMCTNLYQQGSMTHELADVPYLLSRRLEAQGYRCGFTGKWHLGLGRDKSASAEGRALLRKREQGFMGMDAYLNYGTLPTDIGFIGDDFPGHGDGGNETPQFQDYLAAHGLRQVRADAYRGTRPGDHSKGSVITSGERTSIEYFLSLRAQQIVDQLAESGEPFFLSLNFWGPHEPYHALAEDYAHYRDCAIAPWRSFSKDKTVQSRIHKLVQRPEKDWSFFENNLRHYYAVLSNIDRQIGRFLAHLKEKGLLDDCYIVFTSDHGDSQGCHNGMENKAGHLYDDTAKIPLMIRPPRGMKTAVTVPHLASTVDLYATMLDIAGYPSAQWQSGVSLRPLLQKPDVAVRQDVVTECVSAFPIVSTQRLYRAGPYKYIFNSGGTDELYHLTDDPFELCNLADTPNAEALQRQLQNDLADAMERHGDPILPWYCKMNHLREWSLP